MTRKFIAAVRKWEVLAATKVKVSGSEKKGRGTHTECETEKGREVSN